METGNKYEKNDKKNNTRNKGFDSQYESEDNYSGKNL